MATYTSELASITKEEFEDKTSELYKKLVTLITPDMPELAHKHALALANDLATATNYKIETRPVKKYERIMAKANAGRPLSAFQANTDVMAFRMACKVVEIDTYVKQVAQWVTQNNGYFMVKYPYIQDGVYTDIIAFCYAYVPKYEYIMEMQIGEPLAFYTFKRDSALRDTPNCGLVDLWKNNFYTHIVEHLLKKNVHDLHAELKQLYSENEPEPELTELISNIY